MQLTGEPKSSPPSAPLVPSARYPAADAAQANEVHEVVTAKTLHGHQYSVLQRRGIDRFKGRRKRASFAVFVDFWLDARSSTSLWRQLYEQLRQAIIGRRLPSGTRLPATRLLAEELGCSRNTILGAFEQLIAEGYLEARIGSGTYVADMLPDDVTLPVGLGLARSKAACTLDTTTAVGPFGQAVTNQKADVIAIASAQRIAVRAASTGSDQKPSATFGAGRSSPRSKAVTDCRSRARARATACSSVARTSVDTTAPFPAGVSFASEINSRRLVVAESGIGPTRRAAAPSTTAQSSTAASRNSRRAL